MSSLIERTVRNGRDAIVGTAPVSAPVLLHSEPVPVPMSAPFVLGAPPAPVTPFIFEGLEVRVVTRDGEPWFVAKDAAGILGYVDAKKAVSQHCKGVAIHHPLQTAGGLQNVRIISEPDLLRLIIGSHLPAAEKFERWVFEEVLPTIRKTGSYTPPTVAKLTREQLFAQAILGAAEMMKEKDQQIAVLGSRCEKLKVHSDALKLIAATEGLFCLRDSAKLLRLPPTKIGKKLEEKRWVFKSNGAWAPYQTIINRGYMRTRLHSVTHADGQTRMHAQPMLTSTGLLRLALDMQVELPPDLVSQMQAAK